MPEDQFSTQPAAASPAEVLSAECQGLKGRVIAQIAAHFARHPQPVNNIDRSMGTPNYLPLLDYSVTTAEESEAYITELRAEGFAFETHFTRNGGEDYATLPVEELLDVLRVLEKSQQPAESSVASAAA